MRGIRGYLGRGLFNKKTPSFVLIGNDSRANSDARSKFVTQQMLEGTGGVGRIGRLITQPAVPSDGAPLTGVNFVRC